MEKSQSKPQKQQEDLKQLRVKLLNNCKDRRFAEKLLDEILSKKGEIDVEPSLIHVSVDEVIKEYDFKSFQLIKTKKEIIYKQNGYRCIIKPWLNALYGQLQFLMDCKDKEESLSDVEKNNLEDLLSASILILQLPTIAFTNDEFMFETATNTIKYMNKLAEESMSLKEENEEANEQFKEAVLAAEDAKDSVK